MIRPSDEALMAYADNQLDEHERAAVEAYLATDPEACKMIEDFRLTMKVAAAYEQPMREPPPEHLVALIMGRPAGSDQGTSRPGAVVQLRPAAASGRAGLLRRRPPAFLMAMAASVALVVAGASGYLGGRWSRSGASGPELALGLVAPGSKVSQALETAPSGTYVAMADGKAESGRLLVVATFRDRAGRPCREIEQIEPAPHSRPTAAAIACRIIDGRWVVEGVTQIQAEGPRSGVDYIPSGVQERDALEGLLRILGAGRALSTTEEAALLHGGWQGSGAGGAPDKK